MKSVLWLFTFLIISLVLYLHYSQRFAYLNALIYQKLGMDADAAEMFEKACRDTNPKACIDLGMMYEEGRGADRNHTKAMQLYQSAHDHGFIPAKEHLKRMDKTVLSGQDELKN